MKYGLISGVLWALDTVVLGLALAMAPFISNEQAIFLAPFVSTFLHDLFSTMWMALYMISKKEFKNTIRCLNTKSGRFIMGGALLGGPVGMTGYLLAIKYIGPTYTAIISSLYPAIGAFLSYIFLKEKMKPIAVIGLIVSITGIIILGYSPNGQVNNLILGFMFAIMCVIGWASEAVICAYGMKDNDVTPEQSLQIRQFTSAMTYGILIIPIAKGVGFVGSIFYTKANLVVLLAALAGTASYVFYYKGIHKIGATKAMSLNITYSAWAIIFGILMLGNSIEVKSIICSIMIILGSILAAGDMNDLMGIIKINKKSTKIN